MRRGTRVKMPGTGHSFSDIALTDGTLLHPSALTGVVGVDRAAMTVTVLAGTTLRELNATLVGLGLSLHNMGDVEEQTVAGAISTGTHGTGGVKASLSAQVVRARAGHRHRRGAPRGRPASTPTCSRSPASGSARWAC